jgi:hypothetical protein
LAELPSKESCQLCTEKLKKEGQGPATSCRATDVDDNHDDEYQTPAPVRMVEFNSNAISLILQNERVQKTKHNLA